MNEYAAKLNAITRDNWPFAAVFWRKLMRPA
jgi:hypothetical protein